VNPIRLALLAERTSYRTDPPGTGEPEWKWEDYAYAAAAGRCTPVEAAALEFRWRGVKSCRYLLYGALLVEAVKAEKRHGWSERIQGQRYLDALVQLSLDVEEHPALDGQVPLVLPDGRGFKRFAGFWCLRLPWMSEAVWQKHCDHRYSVIRSFLDMWVSEAVRKCSRALRADHDTF
jgi:hypothetical protein